MNNPKGRRHYTLRKTELFWSLFRERFLSEKKNRILFALLLCMLLAGQVSNVAKRYHTSRLAKEELIDSVRIKFKLAVVVRCREQNFSHCPQQLEFYNFADSKHELDRFTVTVEHSPEAQTLIKARVFRKTNSTIGAILGSDPVFEKSYNWRQWTDI